MIPTFKRHLPSPPLNADDFCCHPPPPMPQFDCCVTLPTDEGGRRRQYLPPPIPLSDICLWPSSFGHLPLQLNFSRLAAASPYYCRLRRTPSHIADTFKRHRPSPPLNADDFVTTCHHRRLDLIVASFFFLWPRRLAFVHRRRHWKTPPPSKPPPIARSCTT